MLLRGDCFTFCACSDLGEAKDLGGAHGEKKPWLKFSQDIK